MGNAPSQVGGSGSGAPGQSSTNVPASSSSPQPIAGSTSASAFHSGLTPPAQPPSPPPPSTPPLLPHGGHLSPQNPHALSHPQAHDYSKTIVTKLIMSDRLAPFYRGLEDWEEEWTEEDVGRILGEVREKDYEEGVENSVVEMMKAEREGGGAMVKKMGMNKAKESRREEEKEERERRERRAYIGATECPICFLNYPPNINTSRCCQQPICTECFVQIKRGEATITHIESEPASCPFCVETDFGVIHERPSPTPHRPIPLSSSSALASQSAISISPDAGTSGLSQALSMSEEDAELNVGIGMAPKIQETLRRKSVSHTSKEVVTIDEVRPDWENKLNTVKAAAARKASRRIVMRQVGDQLIPIGYTSSRAPGTADFSMSVGRANPSENASGNNSPRGGRRRGSRGRDLEELMIMEAMRLSLLDHEEHQQRQIDEASNPNQSSGPSAAGKSGRRFTLSVSGQNAGASYPDSSSRRASDGTLHPPKHEKSQSTAAKIFSKLGGSGNRSRSGSTTSSLNRVTFSPSTTQLPSSPQTAQFPIAGSANSPTVASPMSAKPVNAPSASPPTIPTPISRSPPSSLTPATAVPIAPVTTLANHTAVQNPSPVPPPAPALAPSDILPAVPSASKTKSNINPDLTAPTPAFAESASPSLPRISLDMAPMVPDTATALKTGAEAVRSRTGRAPLNGAETGLSDEPSETHFYAQLESDEE